MLVRDKITQLFDEVGKHYMRIGVAGTAIHEEGHDVHVFYRLSRHPPKVIHVQGYPGLSSNDEAYVHARMMDYDQMMGIRENRGVSVGNEHEATIQHFPNFESGARIPYDSEVLEKMLVENVPELTRFTFKS